jgi:hypothetical protein
VLAAAPGTCLIILVISDEQVVRSCPHNVFAFLATTAGASAPGIRPQRRLRQGRAQGRGSWVLVSRSAEIMWGRMSVLCHAMACSWSLPVQTQPCRSAS